MQEHTPAGHAVLGWDVADIAATVTELAKAGAKFERYDVLPQDELGSGCRRAATRSRGSRSRRQHPQRHAVRTIMNLVHRYLCRSDGWRRTVETQILPWALNGVDLGANVLEVGPGLGLRPTSCISGSRILPA